MKRLKVIVGTLCLIVSVAMCIGGSIAATQTDYPKPEDPIILLSTLGVLGGSVGLAIAGWRDRKESVNIIMGGILVIFSVITGIVAVDFIPYLNLGPQPTYYLMLFITLIGGLAIAAGGAIAVFLPLKQKGAES